jgi:hypothetical protein
MVQNQFKIEYTAETKLARYTPGFRGGQLAVTAKVLGIP